MGRNKTQKKDEFNSWPNCINADESMKGRWREHFGNDHPIVAELGCGKGDLATGLAKLHPEINYIGVDIKGTRMWTGAKAALDEGISNLAFLRCDIHFLANYFEQEELDGIWITFPDPYPKKKRSRNRMTNEVFLREYCKILNPEATMWFKTDNKSLFQYTLDHFAELNEMAIFHTEILEKSRDLHASPLKNAENGITTDYERRFLDMGKAINYMSFKLRKGPKIHLVPATGGIGLDPDERAPRLRY